MPRRRPRSLRPPIVDLPEIPVVTFSTPPDDRPVAGIPVSSPGSLEDPGRLVADRERLELRERLIRTIARQIAIDFLRDHGPAPRTENDPRC